jgi:hypothetical protein
LKREGRTDKTGEYQLAGLPTGTYTLRVGKEGFQTEVREGIAVSPGAAIAINLSPVVGQLSEHVTIEAGVPALDTTSASVRGVIAERSLTELPLDGPICSKPQFCNLGRPQRLAVLLHYYRMAKRVRCS